MASYKDRLRGDLDRWIGQGLVPESSRGAILDSVAESRRPDAVTVLGMFGVVLAGAAIIAFVGANWNGIPRLARFALLLTAFLGACAGGAWADWRARPNLSNGLIALAAAIYAAAIGLTGQIFDIAGDPKAALLGAGLAATLLALAGRSSGAAVAALVLIGFGDFAPPHSWWVLPASLIGGGLAWLWRSRPTAHAAAIGLCVGAGQALWQLAGHDLWGTPAFAVSGLMALAALASRAVAAREHEHEAANIFYGWLTWGALFFFLAGSADWRGQTALLVAHRVVWLLLSGAVLTLGRIDRQAGVMAAGVVSLIVAMFALLMDLGVDLMTASLVFAIAAAVVLAVVWLLRGRQPR